MNWKNKEILPEYTNVRCLLANFEGDELLYTDVSYYYNDIGMVSGKPYTHWMYYTEYLELLKSIPKV